MTRDLRGQLNQIFQGQFEGRLAVDISVPRSEPRPWTLSLTLADESARSGHAYKMAIPRTNLVLDFLLKTE